MELIIIGPRDLLRSHRSLDVTGRPDWVLATPEPA